MPFPSDQDSHHHSLQTLQILYEYDDFMASIGTMVDMGCGNGLDLEWWATRTSRDDARQPLNITCTGIDVKPNLAMAHRYPNINYQPQNFETEPIMVYKKTFDVIWCHDSWQYVIDPFRTLRQWRSVMGPDSMLILIVPQSTNLEFNKQAFDQQDYCYHNWTMVSLLHVLAVTGFDCANGYFLKRPEDPWLHAVVYPNTVGPQDPASTSWYQLAEQGLLPTSAADSISRHGFLRQRDLVLPWLDKSFMSYAQH